MCPFISKKLYLAIEVFVLLCTLIFVILYRIYCVCLLLVCCWFCDVSVCVVACVLLLSFSFFGGGGRCVVVVLVVLCCDLFFLWLGGIVCTLCVVWCFCLLCVMFGELLFRLCCVFLRFGVCCLFCMFFGWFVVGFGVSCLVLLVVLFCLLLACFFFRGVFFV